MAAQVLVWLSSASLQTPSRPASSTNTPASTTWRNRKMLLRRTDRARIHHRHRSVIAYPAFVGRFIELQTLVIPDPFGHIRSLHVELDLSQYPYLTRVYRSSLILLLQLSLGTRSHVPRRKRHLFRSQLWMPNTARRLHILNGLCPRLRHHNLRLAVHGSTLATMS
jgi:hypothetical protein